MARSQWSLIPLSSKNFCPVLHNFVPVICSFIALCTQLCSFAILLSFWCVLLRYRRACYWHKIRAFCIYPSYLSIFFVCFHVTAVPLTIFGPLRPFSQPSIVSWNSFYFCSLIFNFELLFPYCIYPFDWSSQSLFSFRLIDEHSARPMIRTLRGLRKPTPQLVVAALSRIYEITGDCCRSSLKSEK